MEWAQPDEYYRVNCSPEKVLGILVVDRVCPEDMWIIILGNGYLFC